jgi:hypothetical protein
MEHSEGTFRCPYNLHQHSTSFESAVFCHRTGTKLRTHACFVIATLSHGLLIDASSTRLIHFRGGVFCKFLLGKYNSSWAIIPPDFEARVASKTTLRRWDDEEEWKTSRSQLQEDNSTSWLDFGMTYPEE